MITIRLDSDVPLEDQIHQGIRRAIARGHVRAGQELPSVRQLGADLGVHWNTVARAYRRLRDEGLVVVGQGRAAFVRETSSNRRPPSAAREKFRQKLEEAFTEAQLGGLAADEVRQIFLNQLKASAAQEEES